MSTATTALSTGPPGPRSLLPLRKVLRASEDKGVGEGPVGLDGWVLGWILAGKARGSVIVDEYSYQELDWRLRVVLETLVRSWQDMRTCSSSLDNEAPQCHGQA